VRIGLARSALYGLRRGFDAIRHRPHLRRMTHLELNDIQPEVLIRELSSIVQNDPPPQPPYQGSEGDPWDAPTGARTRAAAAPKDICSTGERQVSETARLGRWMPLHISGTGQVSRLAPTALYETHIKTC
jgi:hypothetical protein